MAQASEIITANGGPWAGKVKAWPARPPTWTPTPVLAVVEVEIEAVGIYQLHVVRSARGFLYAKSPSSKSSGTWIDAFTFTDRALRDAVHSVAIASYLAMAPAQEGCTVHGHPDQQKQQDMAPVHPAMAELVGGG